MNEFSCARQHSCFQVKCSAPFTIRFSLIDTIAECATLADAHTFFHSTSTLLQQWLASTPALQHLFRPISVWFEGQYGTSAAAALAPAPPSDRPDVDNLMNTLLVVVQNLLAHFSRQSEASDEDNDNVIRDNAHAVRQTSNVLALADVNARVNGIISSFPGSAADDVQHAANASLPFLKRYATLARQQLHFQTAWARSLLKLTYVLSRTALTVAKEGFCRPPDTEADAGDGEGKALEGAEGTGLGAGQGAEDVSKEIEDEAQVEGLKGEQEQQQDGEKGEGDAIEMSEDFAGEMQDVEKGEDEEKQDEEEEDGPEPEDQLGDLDSMDTEAVDEKMWSGEKGPEDGKDDQHAGDNGVDQPGQKDGEMAAKEEEGKKDQPNKEDANDQPREVQEPAEDQQVEENGEDIEQPEDVSGEGRQMDDNVEEANTLDLPEDLELGGGDEEMQLGDDEDVDMDDGDGDGDEQEADLADADGPQDERPATPRPDDAPDPEDKSMTPQDSGLTHEAPEENSEQQAPDEPTDDPAIANPDVSAGDSDTAQGAEAIDHDVGDNAPEGQGGSVRRAVGDDAGDQEGLPEPERYVLACSPPRGD
jgi:midasin